MPASKLFIDIETIPGGTFYEGQLVDAVKPPATHKKPETIAEWDKMVRPMKEYEARHQAGLMAPFCRIVALSWALEDQDPVTYYSNDEGKMLKQFFDELVPAVEAESNGFRLQWIGHNITGFDLNVLWWRCMANNVSSPLLVHPRTIKPWETDKVFDTLYQLAGTNTKGHSLSNMAKLFQLEDRAPDIDGSLVWDLWRDGEHKLVAEYCENDVQLVRQLYKRIAEWCVK